MAYWYKADGDSNSISGKDVDDSYPCSTRSPVVCRHAALACSQPLASMIGIDLLKNKGANAADAAIAVAAALCVLEPCSTGLGGDMFCLYYNAQNKQVTAINGSGKSPANLTRDKVFDQCGSFDSNNHNKSTVEEAFANSPLSVTVPGAAMGWQNLYDRHGSGNLSLAEILEPAAVLAEEGFPVSPITAFFWQSGFSAITRWYDKDKNNAENTNQHQNYPLTTKDNQPPNPGDIVYNPHMARVLRELGQFGATEGFYNSWIGQAIVDVVQKHGGCLSVEDMKSHTTSLFPEPISVNYRDIKLWQVPPNGQGIAGLIALAGLQHLEQQSVIPRLTPFDMGSARHYHTLIEMMRLGFADARKHVADPDYMEVSCNDYLLDPQRIGKRVDKLFNPNKAVIQGIPDASSCTVSFQVIDQEGNAISFVNSNYLGFGSGIVPNNCGFTLQNRGSGFSLEDNHPNVVGPSKRPYHTIIPGMITYNDETNDLYATISNMGGNMQPQGHLQLLVNMVAGGMNPQAAIDAPRFSIVDGSQHGLVVMETGTGNEVIKELREKKEHKIQEKLVCGYNRSIFGRAQIIKRDRSTGVLWAGSDGRADGYAIGF